MEPSVALTWSWLNVLTYKRYLALKQEFGDLEAALGELDVPMLRGLGCREETAFSVMGRLEEFDAAAYARELQKRGISFVSIEDVAYPARLKTISDPPVFLYVRGDVSVCDRPALSLVGTRTMSAYGERVTEHMAAACAAAQVVTVSGLAKGVDTVVAKATLAASGPTVAVLAHGLSDVQPSQNRKLAESIVQEGGAILSEYPLDVSPDNHTFVARNRIVAGLSLATVVCEAPAESGALITAKLALDYNRDVYAVPGQIFDSQYAGCNHLIATGQAQLAQVPADVLKTVGIVAPSDGTLRSFAPENDAEAAVWNVLTTMPQDVTAIGERSGLSTNVINATLTMLELRGVVKNAGAGQWVRA